MATEARRNAYKESLEQIKSVLSFEPEIDKMAVLMMGLSNASSILFYEMNKEADPSAQLQKLPVNWCGFYLMTSATKLTLGPFQGKVACMQIKLGKGVCGTAVLQRKSQVVPDVHALANHIACDSESESEVVIPIKQNGQIVAVLDIDSTVKGYFSEEDAKPLEEICEVISNVLTFPAPVPLQKFGSADKPQGVAASFPGAGAPTPSPFSNAPMGRGPVANAAPVIKEKVVAGWKVCSSTLSRMADTKVLASLEDSLQVKGLPEILFDHNILTLTHQESGTQLKISAEAALRAASVHYKSAEFEARKGEVTVPTSNSWKEKRATHQVFDPSIDWAFRCDFKGEWQSSNSSALLEPVTDAEEQKNLINWDELKDTKLQMMLFDSYQLFDDDLHDHGLSQLSVKFRVMESCFFVLVHHFLRIDGHMVMIQDTRFYHHFGDKQVVVARSDKRKDLPAEEQTPHGPRPSAPADNEELASSLPLLREDYYTVNL